MSRGPVIRFVLLLALLMIAFNVAFYLWLAECAPFQTYLAWNAQISGFVLRMFGESAMAEGVRLASPRFSMEIKHGCDALQPAAFFVFAMLLSPVRIPLRARVWPIAVGTIAILLLNLVRIISLYYTGVLFPSAFEIMHIDVWQALFILAPLAFWFEWARRAARAATSPTATSTSETTSPRMRPNG